MEIFFFFFSLPDCGRLALNLVSFFFFLVDILSVFFFTSGNYVNFFLVSNLKLSSFNDLGTKLS